jgi:hypothetical protein
MDNPQKIENQPKTKNIFQLQLLIAVCASFIYIFAGFILGRFSIQQQNVSVLGVENPMPLSSRLAALLQLNHDGSGINSGFMLSPDYITEPIIQANSEEPTHAPLIEPTTPPIILPTTIPLVVPTADSMVWSGSNRNPQPTVSPKPTTYYVTPTPYENTDSSGTKQRPTATPTPKYRTDWDRNTPIPMVTIYENPENIIDENFTDENGSKTSYVTPTPTVVQSENKGIQSQINKIIDDVGINLEKPQISAGTDHEGFTIDGTVKDTIFGIIPIRYPIEIIMNETSGQIEHISIPWWRTLFGNPFVGTVTKVRCGDGICNSTESYDTCKADCTPICGNGICEYGEGQDTCPEDCDFAPTPESIIAQ